MITLERMGMCYGNKRAPLESDPFEEPGRDSESR